MGKKNKIRAFFAFLLLSAYFFMLTPLYTYQTVRSENIRQAVGTDFTEENCKNLLKKIENYFRLL